MRNNNNDTCHVLQFPSHAGKSQLLVHAVHVSWKHTSARPFYLKKNVGWIWNDHNKLAVVSLGFTYFHLVSLKFWIISPVFFFRYDHLPCLGSGEWPFQELIKSMCLRDPNQGRSVKLNGRRVSPKSDGLSCLSSYRVYPHSQTRSHDSFASSASASLNLWISNSAKVGGWRKINEAGYVYRLPGQTWTDFSWFADWWSWDLMGWSCATGLRSPLTSLISWSFQVSAIANLWGYPKEPKHSHPAPECHAQCHYVQIRNHSEARKTHGSHWAEPLGGLCGPLIP